MKATADEEKETGGDEHNKTQSERELMLSNNLFFV